MPCRSQIGLRYSSIRPWSRCPWSRLKWVGATMAFRCGSWGNAAACECSCLFPAPKRPKPSSRRPMASVAKDLACKRLSHAAAFDFSCWPWLSKSSLHYDPNRAYLGREIKSSLHYDPNRALLSFAVPSQAQQERGLNSLFSYGACNYSAPNCHARLSSTMHDQQHSVTFREIEMNTGAGQSTFAQVVN